jgi:hypothetical protein
MKRYQALLLPVKSRQDRSMAIKISFEGKIGIAIGLLGLFGAGVVILRPDLLPLGWLFVGVSLLGGLALAGHHAAELWHIRRAKMYPFIGMVVCGFGFIGFCGWYYWPTPTGNRAHSVPQSLTFKSSPSRGEPVKHNQQSVPISATPPLSVLSMASVAHSPQTQKPLGDAETPIRLVLECVPASPLDTVPPSGLSYSLAVPPPGGYRAGTMPLGEVRTIPGTSLYGNKPFVSLSSRRCTVTNYSDTAIANVIMKIRIIYYDVTRKENVTSLKDFNSEEYHPIFIDKIDPGIGRPYQFNIDNWSGDFIIDVLFENEISALRVDTGKTDSFPFVVAGEHPIRLFP